MSPLLRNIFAVMAGIILGNAVNMVLIGLSPSVIPPPAGADTTTMEGLAATIHLFEPKHFLMPFLAHALGTLAGAFAAAKLATTHKQKFAIGMGVFFLLLGITAVFMIPAPMWFNITDLVLAYVPMGVLGGWLARTKKAV